jgi:hypothetical protein
MYYRSEIDRLLSDNFKQIEGLIARDDRTEVEGRPAEISEDRWSDIPSHAVRKFHPGDDDAPGSVDDENRRLGQADAEHSSRIERVFREVGVEAIAFYKSRRYLDRRPFPGLWGVFYLKSGVEYLASRLRDYYGVKNPLEVIYSLIRRHEFFHYKADIHTMLLELISKQQLYTPTRRAFRRAPYLFVEEALANREILTSAQRRRGSVLQFAKDWMNVQPGAYARYGERVEELTAEWAANVLDGDYRSTARRYALTGWAGSIPDYFAPEKVCPEYLIDYQITSTLFPPLFKMPKVRAIKDSDDIQMLINRRHHNLREQWETQKAKLLTDPGLPGLNFKPWPREAPRWSVRVNSNFRAHLDPPVDLSDEWLTMRLGTHKDLGHG